MIPVTVDVAFSFPFKASYFPRSVAQAEDMRLLSPLIKKPRRNIQKKKIALGIVMTQTLRLKATREAKMTAKSATGDRFPYILSDM